MRLRKILLSTILAGFMTACGRSTPVPPTPFTIPTATIEEIIETEMPVPTPTKEELIPHNSIIYVGRQNGEVSPLYSINLETRDIKELLPEKWTDMYIDELLVDGDDVFFDSDKQRYHVDLETGNITKSDNQDNILEPVEGFDIEAFQEFQPYKGEDDMYHRFRLGQAYYAPDINRIIFNVNRDQYVCWDLWVTTGKPMKLGECVTDMTVGLNGDNLAFVRPMGYDSGYELHMANLQTGETRLISQSTQLNDVEAAWKP